MKTDYNQRLGPRIANWRPDYQMKAAMCALSPEALDRHMASIFEIAPNPFEQGKKNEKRSSLNNFTMVATRLIWC